MLAFARAIDALNERLGRLLAWALPLMMVLTVAVVVLRYAFGIGANVLQDSVIYLHAALFMLGAAYTLKHNAHVRVDILYNRWPAKRRALIDIAGTLLFLLPVAGFIAVMSWDYVLASWRVGETSADGGLPFVYLLKTLLLAMPALLVLQGLAELARNIAFLSGQHPELHPEPQHHETGEL